MPQHVRYQATREIIASHSLNVYYDLDLQLRTKDLMATVKRKKQISLAGRAYITYHHTANQWRCKTRALSGADMLSMREFLFSAVDQVFFFDHDNASGYSPDAGVEVILAQDSLMQKRQVMTGTQANDSFVFSFVLRQVNQ